MVPSRALLAALLWHLLILTGCANSVRVIRFAWQGPPGLQQAHGECVQEANAPSQGMRPPIDLYKDCMEGRGYTKLPATDVTYPARYSTADWRYHFTLDERCKGETYTCIWP